MCALQPALAESQLPPRDADRTRRCPELPLQALTLGTMAGNRRQHRAPGEIIQDAAFEVGFGAAPGPRANSRTGRPIFSARRSQPARLGGASGKSISKIAMLKA